MPDNDLLHRFIFDTVPVRGEYICIEKSYQTIVNQHAYPSPIRHLLGEALCVAGLLRAIIKFKGRLTVQFRGKGKLKLLLAQCDDRFNIRGLAKWEGDLGYPELMQAFTQGVLVIMIDMEDKQNAYQGIVNWQGNSLAASIEGYFRDSEQLATKIWLNVSDVAVAGLLLQIIPATGKDTSSLEMASSDQTWQRMISSPGDLDKQELLTMNYEALLQQSYPDDDIRIFRAEKVQFNCSCSRKRSEDAIYLLGKEEAEDELKKNNSIMVTCDFCNKEYSYDRVDVAKIFADRDGKNTKPIH